MKSNEYNPIHIHQGNLPTGLTSVMILKVPSHYGVEYSAEDKPQNGRLQILGSAAGQFANINYTPPMQVRDFYVFPYDMRHCVYPFNGKARNTNIFTHRTDEYELCNRERRRCLHR